MTAKEIEQNYGICGLACALCGDRENCAGCLAKEDSCDVKACCRSKNLTHCFLCDAYPCDKDMHKGKRGRAFNTVARKEGLHALAAYLYANYNRGVAYHRPGGLTGDYDRCETEREVIALLKNGRPDPYDRCPVYESERFLLRLVSVDDAEDLLACYKNPTISVQGNAENCEYGYGAQSLGAMRDCIRRWLEEYENRCFIRFSILDKQKNKAAGTVEIFGGWHGRPSVLRIDTASPYENEEALWELLKISDSFFRDIKCGEIVSKGVPEAVCRINALTKNGYTAYPVNTQWDREHYYIKRGPEQRTNPS
ncbi:MAG: DUF3795 domain-containing protein [Firmicutes bacterium]|nr:DUF3795 domain-containing protein [Bacillota bacterium]